jgi:hypothetical protein
MRCISSREVVKRPGRPDVTHVQAKGKLVAIEAAFAP